MARGHGLDQLAGQQAHAPGGAARLQALIGLLLLFRRDDGLTCIATLPYPGSRDEWRATPAALFRHGLLERENARFLGQ